MSLNNRQRCWEFTGFKKFLTELLIMIPNSTRLSNLFLRQTLFIYVKNL